MWDKLRKKAFEGCEILEFVMAMIVGLAILMAIVGVFPGLLHFGEREGTHMHSWNFSMRCCPLSSVSNF